MGKKYLAITLTIFSMSSLFAQNTQKDFILSGIVIDSASSEVVAGALISVLFNSDTIHTQTDEKGCFVVRTQQQPKMIEIIAMGFDITRVITNKSGMKQDYGIIKIDTKSYVLNEIEIKARLKKVSYRGDTIQFNAKAFQIKKWDSAGDLLEKMPGLDVDKKEGTISYENKLIKRVYIDGKLVFGEGTSNLMEYLDAVDIDKVDLYEELKEENKSTNNTNAEKDWVMNFETFNKLTGTSVAQIDASLGQDEQRNTDNNIQKRYVAGVSLSDFSEKSQIVFKYLGNNINRETSKLNYVTSSNEPKAGYNRDHVAELLWGQMIDKSMMLNVYYSYDNNFSRNNSINHRIYTPADDFYSRLLSDTIFSMQKQQTHNLNIRGNKDFKKGSIWYTIKNTFTNRSLENAIFNSNIKDDIVISKMRGLRNSNNSGYSGNYMINPAYRIKPKLSTSLITSINVNRDKVEEAQIDTILQNVYKYTDIGSKVKSNEISVNLTPTVHYNIFSTLTVSGGVRMFTNKADKTKDAIDNYNNQIVSSESYDYSDRSKGLSPEVSVLRQKRNIFLNMQGSWNWTWVDQKSKGINTFQKKLFMAPSFRILYRIKSILREKKVSSLEFTYSGQPQTPSGNMLQTVVDNKNPMYLKSGNRNLKQTYTHRLISNLDWHEEDQYICFTFQGAYINNRIVPNKTLFFDTETILPDYDNYVAPAGSMLSVFENIKDTYSVGTKIKYDIPIYLIYCNLKSELLYNYTNSSEFINTDKISVDQHSTQLGVDLKSDFSQNFEIGIKSKTDYTHQARNNNTKSRILQESVEASLNLYMFDDRLFLSTFYDGRFIKNIDYKESNASANILNFTIGSKLLHRRNGEISVSVFDILNKSRNFTSQSNPAYLINSWKQVPGRYFMVNFSYQFKIKRTNNTLM